MINLTVQMPDLTNQTISLDPTVLILSNDGAFVLPADAKYIGLVPITFASNQIPTTVNAKVLSVDLNPAASDLVIAGYEAKTHLDPTDGECMCFVTCKGSNLSYIKVIT